MADLENAHTHTPHCSKIFQNEISTVNLKNWHPEWLKEFPFTCDPPPFWKIIDTPIYLASILKNGCHVASIFKNGWHAVYFLLAYVC